MNIEILNKIKKCVMNYKIEREMKQDNQKINERNKIINFLYSYLNNRYVKDYNINLIGQSAGWLGGDWTSFDIKYRRLCSNQNLFSDIELKAIYNDLILMKNIDQKFNSKMINQVELYNEYEKIKSNMKVEKQQVKTYIKK